MKVSNLLLASSLLIFNGCVATPTVAPSQNSELLNISPNKTATTGGGAMQNALDKWLKEEWKPLTQSTTGDEKNSNASEKETVTSSGLQHYVDKWKVYHDNKEKIDASKPKEISNIEKLENMPVIGK